MIVIEDVFEMLSVLLVIVVELFEIVGCMFYFRFFVGIGKYEDGNVMKVVFDVLGLEVVIVVLCCVDLKVEGEVNLLNQIDQDCFFFLLNMVGCYIVEDVVCMVCFVCEFGGWNWVKFEVIGCEKMFFFDNEQLLQVIKEFVDDGFVVLLYIIDDLVICCKL